MERFFIVYHNSSKKSQYNRNTMYNFGGGYYVSYKDKLGDSYSDNWILSKRYVNLGSALNRLGIYFDTPNDTKEILYKFENSKSVQRQKKLSRLVLENIKIDFSNAEILTNGRIEVVEINGSKINNLGEIDKNELYHFFCKKRETLKKKHPYFFEKLKVNTDKGDLNDDFWN